MHFDERGCNAHVVQALGPDDGALFDNLLLIQREDLTAINYSAVSSCCNSKRVYERRTLKATVDVADMTFGQGPQPLREIDKRRALASVRTTQTDHGHFREATGVRLENGIDEGGSADADGGDLRRRERSDLEDIPHSVLDTGRDIGSGGRLVVRENATSRLPETGNVDQDTIRVRSLSGKRQFKQIGAKVPRCRGYDIPPTSTPMRSMLGRYDTGL